jgi:YD repeat-containing protein
MKRLFLILLILVASTTLKAQNTGPTAPEAMGFEPVDAQGMVNMLTGNFTYSLPLINIPSPEGGYSMALSYKAGIGVDAEASWVGLGWSLTPGAINRGVNFIPDDLSRGLWFYSLEDNLGESEYRYFSIDVPLNVLNFGVSATWGDFNTVGVSVGVGISDALNLNASATVGDANQYSLGVSFANGVGVGVYTGDNGSGIYGGYTFSGKVGNYGEMASGSVGLSYGTDGIGFSIGGGVGVAGKKYLPGSVGLVSVGGTFSSNGGSFSGGSSVSFSSSSSSVTANNIRVVNHKDPGSIPFISWGYVKQTILLEKNLSQIKYGFMHIDEGIIDSEENSLYHHDTHKSDIANHKYEGIQSSKYINDVLTIESDFLTNDIKNVYGQYELPARDNWNISGQGLMGSISPYIFPDNGTSTTPSSIAIPGNYELISTYSEGKQYYYKRVKEELIPFYKGNDFNELKECFSDIKFLNEGTSIGRIESSDGVLSFNADNTINYFRVSVTDGTNNIDPTKVKQSNYVEWFSNREIAEGAPDLKYRGFIETPCIKEVDDNNQFNHPRLDSRFFAQDGIGAFTISSPDGKRYHYSLPVYQFEQVMDVYKKGKQIGSTYDLNAYATHWLLTAVTGADYIDFNNNGLVDKGDYGYWVSFEYSKWTDGYIWQSPTFSNGTVPSDFDGAVMSGRKQIVYLEAIKTRTHTALFIKKLRDDANGYSLSNIPRKPISPARTKDLSFLDNCPETFLPSNIGEVTKTEILEWLEEDYETENGKAVSVDSRFALINIPGWSYDVTSKKVLGLDKILLLNNYIDDISAYKAKLDETNFTAITKKFDYNICKIGFYDGDKVANPVCFPSTNYLYPVIHEEITPMQYGSVLCNTTLENNPELENEAISVVNFNHDYSLNKGAPGTTNSKGKLTLTGLQFAGKGNVAYTPPYTFGYDLNPNYTKDQQDDWGFCLRSTEKVDDIEIQDLVEKKNVSAYSLTDIYTPIGSKFEISHESDEYDYEAATNSLSPYLTVEKVNFTGSTGIISIEFEENVENQGLITIGNYYNFLKSRKIQLEALEFVSNYKVKFKAYSGSLKDAFVSMAQLIGADCKYYVYCHNYIYAINEDMHSNRYKGCYNTRTNDLRTTDIPYDDWVEWPLCTATYGSTFDLVYFKKYSSISNFPEEFKYIIGNKNVDKYYGGGIRTTAVVLTDGLESKKTTYSYSGGVTAYSIEDIKNRFIPYLPLLPGPNVMYKNCEVSTKSGDDILMSKTKYTYNVLQPFTSLESSLKREDRTIKLGKALEIDWNSIEKRSYSDSYGSHDKRLSKISIDDYISSVGRLEEVSTYNSHSDLLTTTKYVYHDENNTYGRKKETFLNSKMYIEWTEDDPDHLLTKYNQHTEKTQIHLKKVSNVLKETVTKTSVGETKKTFGKIDPNSGIFLETITKQLNNEYYKEVTIPAYNIYTGAMIDDPSNIGMGSKIDNIHNKHMLTQNAATLSYKKNQWGQWKPFAASIQTWNGDWNNYPGINSSGEPTGSGTDGQTTIGGINTDREIWRKHKSYTWRGKMWDDGRYSTAEEDFGKYDTSEELISNWSDLETNENWVKTNEVVRYDHYSTPVEVKDINGDYAATKKDPDNIYTTATIANGSYMSFGATSFEYRKNITPYVYKYVYEGQVCCNTMRDYEHIMYTDNGSGSSKMVSGITAHTGSKYVWVKDGDEGPFYVGKGNSTTNPLTKGKYRAMVWVHTQSTGTPEFVHVNSSGTEVRGIENLGQYGDWKLYAFDFDMNADYYKCYLTANGGDVYADDFRVGPYHGAISSYTYTPSGQVSAIIGSDNFATKYTYDAAGRLIATYRETKNGFDKVSSNKYRYKDQFNAEIEGSRWFDISGGNIKFNVFNPHCDEYEVLCSDSWVSVTDKQDDSFVISALDAKKVCNNRQSYIYVKNPTTKQEFSFNIHQRGYLIILTNNESQKKSLGSIKSGSDINIRLDAKLVNCSGTRNNKIEFRLSPSENGYADSYYSKQDFEISSSGSELSASLTIPNDYHGYYDLYAKSCSGSEIYICKLEIYKDSGNGFDFTLDIEKTKLTGIRVKLEAKVIPSDQSYTYEWSTSGELDIFNSSGNTATVMGKGVYSVKVIHKASKREHIFSEPIDTTK